MKIRSVEYAGTLATPEGPVPGTLPQIAFSGRSNVGKSSLINVLLRRTRSRIARVSGQPGKTQAIHFYLVNDRFFLVDLPGFGYARVPKALRESWRHLIDAYLERDQGPLAIVHLVDARREPTPLDLDMMGYLGRLGLPALVVLTKIDKLKPRQRAQACDVASAALGVDADQVLPFSARTGEGREELLAALEHLLAMEESP